eukprot:6189848-Pleurochrysis_carterae.AAC.1
MIRKPAATIGTLDGWLGYQCGSAAAAVQGRTSERRRAAAQRAGRVGAQAQESGHAMRSRSVPVAAAHASTTLGYGMGTSIGTLVIHL